MNHNDEDIDNLFENWYEVKEQIKVLENKCEKYKKYAEKIMASSNQTTLSNEVYSLTKREMSRTILAKDDVPREIWSKYSKNIKYPMFVIRKIKNKK